MKCRENRKARQKRARRDLQRLAHKLMDTAVYRGTGKSPRYYDVRYQRIATVVKGGRLVIDPRKTTVKVVPNGKYRDVLAQLVKMAAGVVVHIPPGTFSTADAGTVE